MILKYGSLALILSRLKWVAGKEQAKDWIAILLEIIREKKPELLLAS